MQAEPSHRTRCWQRLLVHGSPRIYAELKAKGYQCSENRVARLMQANKIKAKGKKKYIITTDSKHDLPVAENIINRDFTAQAPNE